LCNRNNFSLPAAKARSSFHPNGATQKPLLIFPAALTIAAGSGEVW
jgi:hypothetical protein